MMWSVRTLALDNSSLFGGLTHCPKIESYYPQRVLQSTLAVFYVLFTNHPLDFTH